MPEQLTRHPDVTLEVLNSGAARCGEGLPQQILTACPPARFCKLPGGELCVYGLPEARQMTQISAAEWQAVVGAPAPHPATAPAAPEPGPWALAAAALALGLAVGWLAARTRRS